MITKEITKHLSTVVDIQSEKFHEGVKVCHDEFWQMSHHYLTADTLHLMETVVWKYKYIEPATREAFASIDTPAAQFYIDHTFDEAFNKMPYGLKFNVEWDAVGCLTEMEDYKNLSVRMTNFRISAIPDWADMEVID